MSKKIPLGIALIITLVSVAISSVVTVFVYLNNYSELISELPERSAMFSHLEDVDELVRSEYFGKLDSDTIDNSLVNGYLSGLGDSYCYYISPEYFDVYDNYMKGIMSGSGIIAYFEPSLSRLVVSSVSEYSPAYDAGIEKGMFIASVNGSSVSASNYKDLISVLNDSFEGKVLLTYSEFSDVAEDQYEEIELTCGYNMKSCSYSINENVGYIRISAFYQGTIDEFSAAVEFMQRNNVRSVILDLRNSSGPDVDIAASITDMIVPVGSEGTGALYSAVNESGDVVKQYNSDSSTLNFNFAVLVNDRTECAAELIACDLRDFGKAVIIGEKTAGHGTLQKLFRLDDGGAVYLTVAEIIPYMSDSFDETGVIPDFEILTTDSFKNNLDSVNLSDDIQYQKAYSYLTDN